MFLLVAPQVSLVLLGELGPLFLRQLLPHLSDDLPDLPKLQVRIFSLDLVPDLLGVAHVRHQRLLGSLGRFGNAVGALEG